MTKEKVLEAIKGYRSRLHSKGLDSCDLPHDRYMNEEYGLFMGSEVTMLGLSHCLGMLDQMERFVVEDRMDKVFRWLGFVQGCLWMAGYYTLDELKNHNRPDSTG